MFRAIFLFPARNKAFPAFPGCGATRRTLRRGALLIRGPWRWWVPGLRRTAEEALRRVRDTRTEGPALSVAGEVVVFL